MRARHLAPVLAAALALVATASPADALERPSTRVTGGACLDAATRGPLMWTAFNNDAAPGRPGAYIEWVRWSQPFPVTAFTPTQIPSTQPRASAAATMAVPVDFAGQVRLDYQMVWYDGYRKVRSGYAYITLRSCVPPDPGSPTTTTTTPRMGAL